MHTASVVLMRSQPSQILDIFGLSRKTIRIVRQNLFWAFFYNVAAIALAAAGSLNPITAAGAMVVSGLSLIGNSSRISRAARRSRPGRDLECHQREARRTPDRPARGEPPLQLARAGAQFGAGGRSEPRAKG